MRKKGEFFFEYNAVIESIDKATGAVTKRITIHNLVVNNGLNLVRNWMAGDAVNNPQAIAVGTDATSAQNSDTALGTEVLRYAATITKPENYKVRYAKTFSVGSGVSHAIKEVGIFDSAVASSSTMLARLNCDNTLDADTDLSVTITYTIARV